MQKIEHTNFVEILPDNGNMLYNGETLSDRVFSPTNNVGDWKEISETEAEEIKAQQEAEIQEQIEMLKAEIEKDITTKE